MPRVGRHSGLPGEAADQTKATVGVWVDRQIYLSYLYLKKYDY
jgi:hypothetical protein